MLLNIKYIIMFSMNRCYFFSIEIKVTVQTAQANNKLKKYFPLVF